MRNTSFSNRASRLEEDSEAARKEQASNVQLLGASIRLWGLVIQNSCERWIFWGISGALEVDLTMCIGRQVKVKIHIDVRSIVQL